MYCIRVSMRPLVCSASRMPTNQRNKLSSISEKERQFFKDLSNEWWNEDGPLKALHSMNKIRVPWIKDTILMQSQAKSLNGLKIVDVGCGGGILCEPLARLGAHVTGIDLTCECISSAEHHRDNVLSPPIAQRLQYFNLPVKDLIGSTQFDAVVASEVVEHVQNQGQFISDCLSIVKPGGHLFVTTLNRTMLSQVLGIYMAEYVLNIVPKGTHDWQNFVKPEDLEFLISNNGGNVKMIHGLMYYPLVNTWRWVANEQINYAIHAVKES